MAVTGKSSPTKTWRTGEILTPPHLQKKSLLLNMVYQHCAIYSQPSDRTCSSSVPHIVLTECPSSSESSMRGTTTQGSNTAQQDRSTGSLSYSSYIVKSPRLLLLKQEPSTNQMQSQIPDLNRIIKELQKGVITESSPPSPSLSTPKKPVRLVKTELRIQESFEIDEDKAADDGEEDQFQVQEHKEDIRHSTYRRLDNLEETIRELELSLLDFGNIPSWPQSIPDMDSRTSTSTAPSSGASLKISGKGEIQRPPIPPKPSINSDVAKVQEHTQHLLALTHTLTFSCSRLLILCDEGHESEPLVPFLLLSSLSSFHHTTPSAPRRFN